MTNLTFHVVGVAYQLIKVGDIITLNSGGSFTFTYNGNPGGVAASLDVDNQPGQQSNGNDLTIKQSFIGGGGTYHLNTVGDYMKLISWVVLGQTTYGWEIKAGGVVHHQIPAVAIAQDNGTPVAFSET